jgi:hypothetical protein
MLLTFNNGGYMNDMLIDNEYDMHMDDVLKFECWYHSVIDDVANLIRANGYDKVMLDVQEALKRIEDNTL